MGESERMSESMGENMSEGEVPCRNHGGAPAGSGLLQVIGLTKSYGRSRGTAGRHDSDERHEAETDSRLRPGHKGELALDHVNLTVKQGEFIAVLGRSGAGKSSLIRCLNRLVEPDAGRILWDGQSITGASSRELRRLRGSIGMIFQHFNLLPRLTVLTNVLIGDFARMPGWRAWLGWFTKEQRNRALTALQRVGLAELAKRRVSELSGGQRQRVAIARVLMQRPKLILGDEPTSSLDPVTSRRVMQFLAELHAEGGLTIMLNVHDIKAVRAYTTRVIGLAHGRIVFDGGLDELDEAALERIYPPDRDITEPIPLKE